MKRRVAPSGIRLDWCVRVLGIEDEVFRGRSRREATNLRRILSGREPVAESARDQFFKDVAKAMVDRVRAKTPSDADYLLEVESIASRIKLAVAGWDDVNVALRRALGAGPPEVATANVPTALEAVGQELLRWAAWRALVDARVQLPYSLPLTKKARGLPFRDALSAVEAATGAKSFEVLWKDVPKDVPAKRTVQGWKEGRARPRRDQLEPFIAFLDSRDRNAALTRREELRTHVMLWSVADALAETRPPDEVERLGAFALGVVRRLETALRAALETPPSAMRETLDRVQRNVASRGLATPPEGWARITQHFLLIELWSMVLSGSSQWLTLYALERAAEAPPVDEQATWLHEMAETWTWARAIAPAIPPGGAGKATVSAVRAAREHGERFLVSALLPLALRRLEVRQDGAAWLEVAQLIANDRDAETTHLETALVIVAHAVQADGVTPGAQLVRGAILLRLGQAEEAEALLRVAARDPGCGKPARVLLGAHYERARRYEEAVQVLRPVDDAENPDADVLRTLFACHQALRDTESARAISRRARTIGLTGFEFDGRHRR
jgi:hypothetical protein